MRRSDPPRVGSLFAGYLIERELHGDRTGSVYIARHPRLPRLDVLEVLSDAHSADPGYRARFIRETESTARLNHPNIRAVHDRGIEDGRLWITMQFVDGTDAGQLCAHAPLPLARALHIVDQAARGLDEAHRAGIVHRGLRPGAILVEARTGRPDRILVTDFGIGRSMGDRSDPAGLTSAPTGLACTAPEQLASAEVDHRADIYALGCVLYQLLTGAPPFPRPTPVAVVNAHLHTPPPRATTANPELPPAIDAVIARAMAKNPEDRYLSCGELAAAATVALGGLDVDGLVPQDLPDLSTSATHPGIALAEDRAPRRSRPRLGVVLGAGVVIAVLAASALIAFDDDAPGTVAQPATSPAVAPTTAGKSWAATPTSCKPFRICCPRRRTTPAIRDCAARPST
ncbi:serine/threonine protein kinase [Nocardia huaxiensis]|uniref:non-specific serine/threonine protein kinase n=1 Tax=Nocardia huaxiensis TaxID=2755382 RepID=A0A7D6VB78_9NOCA|nr:serine/threonine-protein kinase [Nocardia huaxiensis]QLY32252.1 serine/threonine protein kinase [Nocardia huaxiensis]